MLLGGDLLPQELGGDGVDWKAGLLTSLLQKYCKRSMRGG